MPPVWSGTLQNYGGYIPTANYTAYHLNGTLMTSDDTHNNSKTDLIEDDLLLPVATVTNATYNEIGYDGFEPDVYEYEFVRSSQAANTFGRSGNSSYPMTSTSLLSRVLTLHANAKHYIFSCWVNAATAGTLTVSLYNTAGTQVSSTPIGFSVNATGQWKYYEIKLATTAVSGSFTVKVQSSVSTNLDDLLFYPEGSEVTLVNHNIYTGLLTSKTNTNGVAEYYGYDNLDRLQFVYDQDKNIVLKKTYVNTNAVSTYASANFSYNSGTIYVNTTVNFTGPSNTTCTPGTYYAWNFGDGTTIPATLNGYQVSHTYTTAGTYTVTLNTTNSIFGNRQNTQNVTISNGTLAVSICQSGVSSFIPPSSYATKTCPPNANSTTSSNFWLISVANGSGNYTYQWQQIYTDGGSGSSAWANYFTHGLSNANVAFSMSTARPFNMRLIVTDASTGNFGISNILGLTTVQ